MTKAPGKTLARKCDMIRMRYLKTSKGSKNVCLSTQGNNEMVDVGEMTLAKRSIRRPCSGSGAVTLVRDPFPLTQLQINISFVLTTTGASGNPLILLLFSRSQFVKVSMHELNGIRSGTD